MTDEPLLKVASGSLKAAFYGNGRQPKCPPDPAFPDGKSFDATLGLGPGCAITLTHPTPECGMWIIACDLCGYSVGVTAAGRPDDPATITVPCKLIGSVQ